MGKKLWDLSGPTLPKAIAMCKFTCYTDYTKLIFTKEEFIMTNEKCRSKRRCLPSLLQGSSPLVRIAEYRKRTKKCTVLYSAVMKLSCSETNEETHN